MKKKTRLIIKVSIMLGATAAGVLFSVLAGWGWIASVVVGWAVLYTFSFVFCLAEKAKRNRPTKEEVAKLKEAQERIDRLLDETEIKKDNLY